MGDTAPKEILKHIAHLGRKDHEARATSFVKALRQSLGRAAEAEFALALRVTGVQSEQLLQESVLRSVDDDMLLVVLDGPLGALGAIAMDVDLLAGMIEKQTMGKLLPSSVSSRPLTETDAAMIEPFINRLIREMSLMLGNLSELIDGFSFGARIETTRHLELLLEAAELKVMRAQIELEGGMRRGELVLVVPTLECRPDPADFEGADQDEINTQSGDGISQRFADGALMQAEADLRAVIWRSKMTLVEFAGLCVDDHIELPAYALENLEIAASAGGGCFGPCKLGQNDGMRALRLCLEEQESDLQGGVRELADQLNPVENMFLSVDDDEDSGALALPQSADIPGFEELAESDPGEGVFSVELPNPLEEGDAEGGQAMDFGGMPEIEPDLADVLNSLEDTESLGKIALP